MKKLGWFDRMSIKRAILKNAAHWHSPVAGNDSLKWTAQEVIEAFRVIEASASNTQADGNEDS
jgi:NTP pyrophosphatase (non-canonical NTP hydrolase)